MDRKQLLDTIEQIDYKILEHITNDEFNIEPTQIPDYLLTARRVLIEKIRNIESKEKEDNESEIMNKIRNNIGEHYINEMSRGLGGFHNMICFNKDEREIFYPADNICIIK